MKIAIYGKNFNTDCDPSILQLFSLLAEHHADILIYNSFLLYLHEGKRIKLPPLRAFEKHTDIDSNTDFILSIGGDGTFLETISLVRDKGIPVIGINTGRLGFLSNIAREEINEAITAIFSGNYKIVERSLLMVDTGNPTLDEFPYALNEFTIQKSRSSMVTIHTWVNNEFLNSYRADGLIVSTPTGSTAYSMSVGGPIATPGSESFIISPIAPHHLTVRPIIVPDTCSLKLNAESRDSQVVASIDNRSALIPVSTEIVLRKAPFTVKTILLRNNSFFNTLRNKLMWGADKRN